MNSPPNGRLHRAACAVVLLLAGFPAAARQNMPHGDAEDPHAAHRAMMMLSAVTPETLMSRDGSGTSWQPDQAPMHALHRRAGSWALMLHGQAFLRFTRQDVFDAGTRGDQAVDAPHWVMGMARRQLAPGSHLAFRLMGTVEPWTQGGSGYPLLFQTGETFDGEPLIDRQHPHDALVEMAAVFGRRLGTSAGAYLYAGYPGEPALGPPAFVHRPAARRMPDSPLSHHWQDATHITYGVATLGVRAAKFKLEGSLFTGREPDEDRWGFDRARFDSYSGRVSVNPSPEWALQFSRGFLKSPEVHEPEVDQVRTTASALFDRKISPGRHLSLSLIWGLNEGREGDDGHGHTHVDEELHHGTTSSYVFEGDLDLGAAAIFTRAEWVEKAAGELGITTTDVTLGIGAVTLGGAARIARTAIGSLSLGAATSVFASPTEVKDVYGANPIGAQIFLRLLPGG